MAFATDQAPSTNAVVQTFPEGDCDCDGNVLDECGVCGGDGIPEGDCDCDGNQLDALGECGGPCEADADSDGICDDVDPCVGELDACGICNGPGAIYECGCSDIPEGDCDCDGNVLDECGVCGGDGIPEGDCDCDGNQLDALGECGGPCEADADSDGICDDIDPCVGELDACGVCNGPGAIYECGCSDIPEGDCDCDGNVLDECGVCGGDGIPEGDCDCDGNQLDALGECGGPCEADADSDGICDDVDPCVGELDACGVCNGPGAIYECGCSDIPEGDCDCDGNVLDECGVCGGDGIPEGDCDCDGNQLDALGECGGPCEADADSDGICDDIDPCVGELDACGICNGPGAIYECGCSDIPEGDCDCDGNVLDECGVCGGDGIPEGDCDCDGNQLDALGECGGPCEADADSDGICDDVDPCVGELDACGVCNGPGAIYECGCSDIPEGDCDCDGNVLDECGVCGGDGIPAGDCDCDGNQLDALGECGGPCEADADGDGICDDIDPCVGELDACGVCNGPGEIYECGCSDIPDGDCDCDGNVLDECGVCGGDGIPAGDCDCDGNQLDALGECGGPCEADADSDGICDDVDTCDGELDACGVCNGPGEIYECGCADIPEGDCDCNGNVLDECGVCGGDGIPEGDCDCDGNQLDAIGVCGGFCQEDVNENGICDVEEECLGFVDACGICNGPGAIYECGCSDIPEGDCDCDGNQLDVVGECGGDCTADEDGDGICDDVDPCVGELDACGVCNGPGEIYECGCADIPEGDCDCDGNQLDALGVCGGDCEADDNGNGLCDADETMGCTDASACNYDADATFDDGSCAELDECGVCGGPGAVYECGCADIPEGDCDCDGNQDDAIGVCGGSCLEDVNDNDICDTDEQGCTDPTNPNYDPNAAFDDGSCFVGGCTFEFACNYNPDADFQLQGACDFTSCQGCTDAAACNYDEEATLDNGLCDFPDFAYDCDGNCLSDSDGDGVCDELEVPGCTESNSPNFNPYATDDDGTCLVGGCNIPAACNYDPSADYLIPGACEFESCVGCTDESACNYDATASVPNLNLCTYPPGLFLNCDGSCELDGDGDGICDQFEIPGCTDPEAQNYNPQATDDNGTCQAALVGGCILPFACNFDPNANFYIPGSCEFAPCGGVAMVDNCNHPNACNFGDEGPCEFLSCVTFGCNVSVACNYDAEAQFNDGSCEYGSCTGCMNDSACDYDPSATIAGGCYDFSSCAGCMHPEASNFDPDATADAGQCIFEGCTVPGACNFDVNANSNNGSCDFASCAGCTDVSACNYDSEAAISGYCQYPPANFDCNGNCLLDNCEAFVVQGCTDACACNYDPFANTADGSCEFSSCEGCIYPTALNFDPVASRDDGSCLFEGCTSADFASYSDQANVMAEEWCTNAPASADFNQDGVVQVEDLTTFLQAFTLSAPTWGGLDWVVSGCTVDALSEAEMMAQLVANQNSAGPWTGTCGVVGCAYPGALNYNPNASSDPGVCLFAGCTDPEAFNYDRLATIDDSTCRYEVCPDFNNDGEVQVSDLIDFLLLWGN